MNDKIYIYGKVTLTGILIEEWNLKRYALLYVCSIYFFVNKYSKIVHSFFSNNIITSQLLLRNKKIG